MLALTLLWPALDHRLSRSDGRWYGLATLVAAISHLLEGAATDRLPADSAFLGSWALALWGTIAVTAALAAGLFRVLPGEEELHRVRAGLWLVTGRCCCSGSPERFAATSG